MRQERPDHAVVDVGAGLDGRAPRGLGDDTDGHPLVVEAVLERAVVVVEGQPGAELGAVLGDAVVRGDAERGHLGEDGGGGGVRRSGAVGIGVSRGEAVLMEREESVLGALPEEGEVVQEDTPLPGGGRRVEVGVAETIVGVLAPLVAPLAGAKSGGVEDGDEAEADTL